MNEEKTKSFDFSIEEVLLSFNSVKRNKGWSGVANESIEAFEKDLNGNVYKIWNRLSSGSYMPPLVKQVIIPKKQGGEHPLGIPTVGDWVAQGVLKTRLERESLNQSFTRDHMDTDQERVPMMLYRDVKKTVYNTHG